MGAQGVRGVSPQKAGRRTKTLAKSGPSTTPDIRRFQACARSGTDSVPSNLFTLEELSAANSDQQLAPPKGAMSSGRWIAVTF